MPARIWSFDPIRRGAAAAGWDRAAIDNLELALRDLRSLLPIVDVLAGSLLTEAGGDLLTEGGDPLLLEA